MSDTQGNEAYEKMLVDVAAHFASPADIVDALDLARDRKIALLKQWDYDLQLLLTASEENMPGDSPGDTAEKIRQVHKALATLGVKPDPQKSGPGKVHAAEVEK
jgi:hypothetical protein